ncbi:hypothetical protein Q8O96_30925 [Pseudomonas sp. LPH60]|uniref:hypothetical protein n=1 Tax=Pseudomonas sp. LPH60 TaxID=3065906 RepID=UPI00273C3CE8|nr:hypothetical protein [Pseudomonas sp. LPH60]MDP4573487.1 hypothetical protein [Pseudomonas sp. LPH60]
MKNVWLKLVLVAWSCFMIVGLCANWPAAELEQGPTPSLPTVEECGVEPFDQCFAAALRDRMAYMGARKEFVENRPIKVTSNIGAFIAIWGSGSILIGIYRNRRNSKRISYLTSPLVTLVGTSMYFVEGGSNAEGLMSRTASLGLFIAVTGLFFTLIFAVFPGVLASLRKLFENAQE